MYMDNNNKDQIKRLCPKTPVRDWQRHPAPKGTGADKAESPAPRLQSGGNGRIKPVRITIRCFFTLPEIEKPVW